MLGKQDDSDAIARMIARGYCIMFEPNTQVYIVDFTVGGLRKVRPHGDVDTLWTTADAIF